MLLGDPKIVEMTRMKENPEEYNIEEDLEDMKEFLDPEKIVCPNCKSLVDLSSEKCPVCKHEMKPKEEDDFANKLKATMWAPGKDRGVPIGKDIPPPPPPDFPVLEKLAEEAGIDDEEQMTFEIRRGDSDYGIAYIDMWAYLADILKHYPQRVPSEAFLRTAKLGFLLRGAISIVLVLFGISFFVIAALFSTSGFGVLAFLFLGSILILIGGNLGFDLLIYRRRRRPLPSKTHLGETPLSFTQRLLRPGDSVGKTVSIFVVIAGGLSYVLLPILSEERILVFVGMAVGAVLIVLGVSCAHNAFFYTEASIRKAEREEKFEAVVETLREEAPREKEFEWACPVCATPLAEDIRVCPECGVEFED